MAGEMIISIVTIILCAAAYVNAFTFPGGTSDGAPGAGVFPQALCAIIIALNVILIILEMMKKDKKQRGPMTEEHKDGLKRMVMMVAATAALVILWGMVHFIILCSLYLIVIGLILRQNMKTFIPGAIVSAVLVFFIFQNVLNVMLS